MYFSLLYKASYDNEEVNRTEPSASVSVSYEHHTSSAIFCHRRNDSRRVVFGRNDMLPTTLAK